MYTLKTFNRQGYIYEKSIIFFICSMFHVDIIMGGFR